MEDRPWHDEAEEEPLANCLRCVHLDRVDRKDGILGIYCDLEGPECHFREKHEGNVFVMTGASGGEELRERVYGPGEKAV